jgi:hypothetical protein
MPDTCEILQQMLIHRVYLQRVSNELSPTAPNGAGSRLEIFYPRSAPNRAEAKVS